MKATTVFLLVAVLLTAIFSYIYLQEPDVVAKATDQEPVVVEISESYAYVCATGGFTVGMDAAGANVVLTHDGTSYQLARTEAASGAKYQSDDGSVVFFEHGGEALVEQNSEIVYQNCSVATSTASTTTLIADSSWEWIATEYADGQGVKPLVDDTFTVTFGVDGQLSATTDCNAVSGTYVEAGDGALSFGPLAMTKKACLGETQESLYVGMLESVSGFTITSERMLELALESATGTAYFSEVRPEVQ